MQITGHALQRYRERIGPIAPSELIAKIHAAKPPNERWRRRYATRCSQPLMVGQNEILVDDDAVYCFNFNDYEPVCVTVMPTALFHKRNKYKKLKAVVRELRKGEGCQS